MLVLLISIIWFAALLFVVALCRIAAHGDRRDLPRVKRSPRLLDVPPRKQTIGLSLEDRRVRRRSRERSKAATAEHVRNGSQEDLHVGP
jgi:hypothetical protein